MKRQITLQAITVMATILFVGIQTTKADGSVTTTGGATWTYGTTQGTSVWYWEGSSETKNRSMADWQTDMSSEANSNSHGWEVITPTSSNRICQAQAAAANYSYRVFMQHIKYSITLPAYSSATCSYTIEGTMHERTQTEQYKGIELFDWGETDHTLTQNINTANNARATSGNNDNGTNYLIASKRNFGTAGNVTVSANVIWTFANVSGSTEKNATEHLAVTAFSRAGLIPKGLDAYAAYSNENITYTYYNKLQYNLNGGSGSIPESDFATSNTVSSTTPIRAGYVFVGWKLNDTTYNSGNTITATSTLKGPLTLVAQWEKIYTPDTESGVNKGKITFSDKKDVTPDDVTAAMNETSYTKTVVDLSVSTVKTSDVNDVISNIKNNDKASGNILIYMKDGISVPEGTTNVIVGNTCINFVVTDRQPVHISKAFTANTASYARSLSSASAESKAWGTICLPYAVNSDTNIQYYSFAGVSGNTIKFSKVANVSANTPAAFCTCASINATKQNENIPVTSEVTQQASDYVFTGIQAEAITLAVGSDNYYIAQNKFWLPTKNTVNVAPQRAYFMGTGSGAKVATLGIEEWEDISTTITDAFSDISGTAKYYDISGKQYDTLQPGLNIVCLANGKTIKVMIER